MTKRKGWEAMTATDAVNAAVVVLSLATIERDSLDALERSLTNVDVHPLTRESHLARVRGFAETYAQTRDARTWFLTTLPPF